MNKENIFDIITGHICEVLPELEGRRFNYSDKLVELGANSVDRAEIIMMTLDSLSLQTPLVDMAGTHNLGELVDLIYSKQ